MSYNNFYKSSLTALLLSAAAFAPTSSASLSPYSQDFEGMTPNQGFPPNDLEADGWRIFGQVFDADPYTNSGLTPRYVYGPFQAANGDPGSIQGVATGEGAQGDVALAKYSDYNNLDQVGSYVQASTFQTQLISTSNAGLWRFTYDAKIGNLAADSSAFAYILIQDFVNPPSITPDIFVLNDTTNLPVEWGRYTLDVLIPEIYAEAGATLSFGFSATSTEYNGSAVFYDNLNFDRVVVPVPAAVWLFGSGLLGLLGVARRRKH
jgi:hypothetical protein